MPDGEASKTVKTFSLAATALLCAVAVFGPFLSGREMFWHDSLGILVLPHIFFEHLFHFKLALWSPELNGGQPLWPVLESAPLMDPLLIVIWFAGHLLGLSTVITGQLAAIAWLFAFSFGGLLLSRRLTRNWWINLSVFVLLFGGPLAWSLPAQCNFVQIFRYFPYVLLCFIDLVEKPSHTRAITLGIVLTLSMAGFQSAYMLFCAAIFAAAYMTVRGKQARPPLKLWATFIGICCAWNIVLFVTALKLTDHMVPVARLIVESWNYDFSAFLTGLLLPFFTLPQTPQIPVMMGQTWHGSSMLGPVVAALAPVPIAIWLDSLVRREESPANAADAMFKAWLVSLVVISALCLGLFGISEYLKAGNYFLGLRNWGLALAVLLLAIVQLAALGAQQLADKNFGKYFFPFYCGIFLFALALWPQNGFADVLKHPAQLLSLLLIPAIFALFYKIARKLEPGKYGLAIFACAAVLIAVQIDFSAAITGYPAPKDSFPLQNPALKLPQMRDWNFPLDSTPFIIMGPAALHRFYAIMPPALETPRLALDFVQLPRYNALLSGLHDENIGRKILGNTAPLLHTVSSITTVQNTAQALDILNSLHEPAVLDNWAVIEGGAPVLPPPDKAAPARIDITNYSETKTEIQAFAAQDCVLVYSDNWDKNWEAYLDGKRVPLLVANVTNKAVFLPSGEHSIKFVFNAGIYAAAFWCRMLFYLFACVWGIYLLRRKPAAA
jgi:hypothetical protein